MTTPHFHFCWTIDCESTRREINDPELGRNALQGFAAILDQQQWRGTFFVTPEEVQAMPEVLREVAARGHEIALHVHPDEAGWWSPHLGVYSARDQASIIEQAIAHFEQHLGIKPVSFRPGFASANDATFGVLAEAGFKQASASMPGRRMTTLASNWGGAELFAHYAHEHNRLLCGSLDLVEIPITVDWETMVWGGLHPQDLRVEFTDAKNQGFVIGKAMRRQVNEDLPMKALVVLTHNLFRYADSNNFRRETMIGMIESMKHHAGRLDASFEGSTIAEAAAAYRLAAPPQGRH